jgi:hypothetical protein
MERGIARGGCVQPKSKKCEYWPVMEALARAIVLGIRTQHSGLLVFQ